jgi:hypothetical protein
MLSKNYQHALIARANFGSVRRVVGSLQATMQRKPRRSHSGADQGGVGADGIIDLSEVGTDNDKPKYFGL